MLVCNVSLRPPRAGIAAAIVEAADAVDAAASGNIVFATLVDDPASVFDSVDAYLGEIMFEEASASDTVTVGLAYTTALDESANAADTQDGTIGIIVMAHSAMLPGVFINSDGTLREAYVDGAMVN